MENLLGCKSSVGCSASLDPTSSEPDLSKVHEEIGDFTEGLRFAAKLPGLSDLHAFYIHIGTKTRM